MRQELLYPGEDSYWVAEVPSLPGCISQGKTRRKRSRISRKRSRYISRTCKRRTSSQKRRRAALRTARLMLSVLFEG